MWEDPIVAEVRKVREDYAAQFNFDLQALCQALKELEQLDPRPKVSFPPQPAKPARVRKSAVILAEPKTPYKSEGE